MSYKDEMIEELKFVLNGGRRATGYYNPLEGKWEINTSDIITSLIQEAGRWCEDYASDLFILWKYNVDIPLENGTIEEGTHVFAMRDSGVDKGDWYEAHKDNSNYYRAVWFLDIYIEDGKMEMVLHK